MATAGYISSSIYTPSMMIATTPPYYGSFLAFLINYVIGLVGISFMQE